MPRSTDYEEYERRIAVLNLLKAEVLPLNKAALFAALDATGVHSIVVCFDGSGDSGQMEDMDAFDAEGGMIEMPDVKVEFRDFAFGSSTVSITTQPLREVLELMTYELLEKTHGGWETGDGAEAAFTFKTADGTITLDYNERYISTNYSQHEF